MGYNKGHLKFHGIDMKEGFHTVAGCPWGFSEEDPGRLAGREEQGRQPHPHSEDRAGRVLDGAVRPRVLGRGVPGVGRPRLAAATRRARAAESFTGPTYCVRPPGVYHGPFTSKNGCLLLETHLLRAGVIGFKPASAIVLLGLRLPARDGRERNVPRTQVGTLTLRSSPRKRGQSN